MDKQQLLRSIPQVDEVLQDADLIFLCEDMPRNLVKEQIREISDGIRRQILDGSRNEEVSLREIVQKVLEKAGSRGQASGLSRVINATGVVIHTNLGRSILSERAAREMMQAAKDYSNLEYDLDQGKRGLRHTHIEKIVTDISGAEAAMVVNNNAAATMLVLSAMAEGREVVVSRGELIEIGGSFRIPEIMEQSGASLKEVGTTNKTKLSDYLAAFSEERTAAFMKVHTSNYRILGFTEEVPLDVMVKNGHEKGIPVIYDMGSGLFADLTRYGIDEPTVPKMLATGVDVIMFSGDKLLGGPQAGIIVGKKKYIDIMKSHPLARALRVDKMTIAALAATLYEYYDPARALREIPVLRMLTQPAGELNSKAALLAARLRELLPQLKVSVQPCRDQVGGGSAPLVYLDGYLVAVSDPEQKAEELEAALRKSSEHIIVRVQHDMIGFDVRTLQEGDEDRILAVMQNICGGRKDHA